uniref:Fungal lipase-type domain-containing protein n=1 Tax=Wuchereria bancrofti TaxID=6293 RepID=A0AAF5PUP3_WUCBA
MITRLIVTYFLIAYSLAVYALVPFVPRYDETEAKILLNLTAGAYSTDPEKCVNNTLPKWQKWLICNTKSTICDAFQNFCSLYIIRSDVMKEIIIVFRGTTTTKQLIVEGWQSMRSKKNFFNIGMVNRYFLQALDKTWPNMEPLLMNPLFKSYQVKFTGHSLGGAIASLAATRTVIQRLRTGNQIKLITFGQPRTGDYQFATYHNTYIPFSFRLVHHLDLVPHLPPCEKDANYRNEKNDKSKPCLTGKIGSPYHHGIEIWYPNGMAKDAMYYECLGYPKSEDFRCSNSLTYDFKNYNAYVNDHRHYFDVHVSPSFHGSLSKENLLFI